MSFLTPINDRLVEWLGPFGPLLAVGLLGVVLILVSLPAFLTRQKDSFDRLRERESRADTAEDKAARLRRQDRKDKLQKYSNFLEPQNAQEYSAVRLKLLQAGYSSKSAVRFYHFTQFALGIGGLVLGLIYTFYKSRVTDAEITGVTLALQIFLPGAAGYFLPKYWVTRRVEVRKQAITNAFPASLDMMLVCV